MKRTRRTRKAAAKKTHGSKRTRAAKPKKKAVPGKRAAVRPKKKTVTKKRAAVKSKKKAAAKKKAAVRPKKKAVAKKKAAAKPKKKTQAKKTPTARPKKRAPVKKKVPVRTKKKAAVTKKSTAKPRKQVSPKHAAPPAKKAAKPEKALRAKRAAASPEVRPAVKVKARVVAPGVQVDVPAKVAPPRPALARAKGKPLARQFLVDLGLAIKEAVAPVARAVKGREIVSTATTGDATFELDRLAEKALMSFLRSTRAPVAYYSEDAGYSTFSNTQPKNLLVVDPVDGTRAAKSGFEGCVVAIASTCVIERPTMADVDNACVVEILGDRVFYAERDKGARLYVDGHSKRVKLSTNADLETVTWAMTVPGRPAELIFPTAARLIDLTSLKGGFFACNSTSFSLTRLLTNQLDACVDFANRYMRDIPDVVRDHFINAGRGVVLGIAPYDLAASLLIAQEAGCVVTNAYGEGFDDVLLLDSSPTNQQSLIAAANPTLHELLLSFFDTRIKQFEDLLLRRAQANG